MDHYLKSGGASQVVVFLKVELEWTAVHNQNTRSTMSVNSKWSGTHKALKQTLG